MKPEAVFPFYRQGVRDWLWFAESRCLALRYRLGRCDRCASACPQSAITFSAGFRASPACTGCGRCAAACPTDALFVEGFEWDRYTREHSDSRYLECERVPARRTPAGTIRMPCLGGVTPARLVALTATRDSAVVIIDRGWCNECASWGRAGHPADESLGQATSWLREAGVDEQKLPRSESRHLAPSLMRELPHARHDIGASRRAFLRAIVSRGAAAEQSWPGSNPGGTGAPSAPMAACRSSARDELIAALSTITRRTGLPLPHGVLPMLAVSDACRNHQVCAVGCPTGALRRYETEDRTTSGITFDSVACIGCGICAQLCPEHAIKVSRDGHDPPSETSIALARFNQRDCDACGQPFTSEDETLCASCRKSRDLAAAFRQLAGGTDTP